MNLALDNLQKLIYHKISNQPTNQPTPLSRAEGDSLSNLNSEKLLG